MPMSMAIVVHGGAGRYAASHANIDAELRRGCEQAARTGWDVLERSGRALEAVAAAVSVLEDNPLFNAGTGATLNSAGHIELDASIMDGSDLRAGAVGALRNIKNPIQLAQRILIDGRHVLLSGDGATQFARSCDIPTCAEEELIVAAQRQRYLQTHGTVGAVALDNAGRIAAATSTGGIFGKLPGRIGDSALIGCGTYADGDAGISCTGNGEAIMRMMLAKEIGVRVAAGASAMDAARVAIEQLTALLDADAGAIVIDAQGRIGYARNTEAMPVAYIVGGRAGSDS